jgi:hypothetical protein
MSNPAATLVSRSHRSATSTTPANWYGNAWTAISDATGGTGPSRDAPAAGTPTRSRPGLDRVDSALTVGNEGDAATRSSGSCTGDQKYQRRQVGQAAFQGGGTLFTSRSWW